MKINRRLGGSTGQAAVIVETSGRELQDVLLKRRYSFRGYSASPGRDKQMRLFQILQVLAAVLALGADAISASPNFVVIFTDDQGYQDVGCFGSPNINTPRLDRMAAEGMKFTDFYAMAPICSASRAGLLTGCYPPRVGTVGVYFPRHQVGLNPDEVTIAEVLKPQGYATACIGKWHLGHHKKFLPTNQGFDTYFGVPYSNDMDPVKGKKRDLDRAWTGERFQHVERPAHAERRDHRTTGRSNHVDQAIYRGGRQVYRRPPRQTLLFVFAAYDAAYSDVCFGGVSYGMIQRRPTGVASRKIDWSVGEVLDALSRNGLDENTLVVFTTDNGPWLNLKPPHHGGSALPLRAGKFTTYEGGMRVPTIVRWKGKVPAGSECNQVAATFDLLPTFARLAGTRPPTDRKIDGRDIWPLMSGESKTSPHDVFYFFRGGGRLRSMRKGNWKLHLATTQGRGANKRTSPPELYDLSSDISESRNVVEQHPALVKQLVDQARAFETLLEAEKRPEGKL